MFLAEGLQYLTQCPEPSERGSQWYSSITDVGVIRRQSVAAGWQHCRPDPVQYAGSDENLTGFRARKEEQMPKTSDLGSHLKCLGKSSSGLVFVQSQPWMETLELQHMVASSDSILLSFKPNSEMPSSEFPFGALCLYNFTTAEFTVHG